MSVRLFGFDVEITASFWFSAALIGFLQGQSNPGIIILWVLVLLVSILVHELGHALAFRWHKVPSSIRLHFMGGVTMPDVVLPLSRGAHVFISLAGPFAGFGLAAICFALWRYAPVPPFLETILLAFVLANVFWGLLNLVPVLPFDGGHVLEHALGPKRIRLTLGISTAVGIAAALWFLSSGSFWGAYLFGSGAVQSYLRLRDGAEPEIPARPAAEPLDPATSRALAEARRALDDDEPEVALRLALAIASGQGDARPTDRARSEAVHLAAWAHLALGRPDEAEAALTSLGRRAAIDAALAGNLRFAQGRHDEARVILEEVRAAGDERKEVYGPLIQILLGAGDPARAAALAVDVAEGISSDDLRTLAGLVGQGGAHHWAGRLYELVFGRDRQADDAIEGARAFARDGAGERALALVRLAVDAGFRDAQRLYEDSALAGLGAPLESVLPRPS